MTDLLVQRAAVAPPVVARVRLSGPAPPRAAPAEVSTGPDEVAAEQTPARGALRVAAGRDAFRFGLVLGSPDLARATARWLDDPDAPMPRAKSLVSLTRYLARAVAKPTPFGSFAFAGLGGWDGPAGDLDRLGVTELHRPALPALWSALARHPLLRDHVELRVNPSVTAEGDRLWFLGAGPGEPIVSVAREVCDVLEFVRAADRAEVRSTVDELVRLGLPEPLRPFPDRSADPLEHLARWVGTRVAGVSPGLRELRAAVTGCSALTTAAWRVERLRRVRGLFTGLGCDPRPARHDDREVVSVDPQVPAEHAASWPAHVRAPHSVCCRGQGLPGPDCPRFVLNTVRTGYGRGVTRVEHLLDAAGIGAPARVPAPVGDVVLAECRAAFGSQLDQRAAAVPLDLDYPGGHPGGGLGLPELSVRHDPSSGRLLLLDRHDRQVRPLALGMLVEHALPPALRFPVGVFGESQTAFAPGRLDDVGRRPAVDGVRRRPRLEVGRVVLTRAGWRVAAADVPGRVKGRSDADFLLAPARRRDRHGIPRRCFVRAVGRRDAVRKPVYVDFADWFPVSALPRPPDATPVFEEALHDPADAPRHRGDGQRVTEFVFEVTAAGPDA